MIAASPIAILQTAHAWLAAGEAVALVTLVGIEGSSSRSFGAQMAITAGGRAIGSFSGGCIEAEIIAQAQRALATRVGMVLRYGQGSRFVDLRLPCGGGIDLCFTPHPDPALLAAALAQLAARRPVVLRVGPDGLAQDNGGAGFALRIAPALRVQALGQGEDLLAFVRLAAHFGLDVAAYSPRQNEVATLGAGARHLSSLGAVPPLAGDAWTGFVFLFHDRDWEQALIPAALACPGFYWGAIGSQRSHAVRCERLAAAGVAPADLARLRGHIGLIHATRDPASLALSVLAELVSAAPVCVSG